MNRFIRYWNQNRKRAIIILVFIAFIIILIRILNYLEGNNEGNVSNIISSEKNKPTDSIITGAVVSEEITDNNTQVIDEFVEKCNEKDYQGAFNLLGDSCKQVVYYNDVNNFINRYDDIFNTKKYIILNYL